VLRRLWHCCGQDSGHSQVQMMFLSDAADVDDAAAAAVEDER